VEHSIQRGGVALREYTMRRTASVALLATLLTSCGASPVDTTKLVLLTRGECVNTPTMRANLDAALTSMSLPNNYQFINIDTLDKSDERTGYPTPTLLFNGRDLFGLDVPTPPYPEPT
jgi:hypothetical protein